MKSEIKAQIEAEIKPKFEADIKIKIEPSEKFNRGMEITKGGLVSESQFFLAQISKNGCQMTTLIVFFLSE